jgi:hypothetical protein
MGEGKNSNRKPEIARVTPVAAIPGGEVQIRGKQLAGSERPKVLFGDVTAPILVGSDNFIVARVPDGVSDSQLVVHNDQHHSSPFACQIGVQIAESLHPVSNPAVDAQATCSPRLAANADRKRQWPCTRSTQALTRGPSSTR